MDQSRHLVTKDKGWCKKNVTTIAKMNIAAFRGYECILYWLIKLSSEFLRFQKATQTIFIGFAYSTLHFDEYFLTKLWIFQKLILHLDWCKSGFRCPTEAYNSSSESLKCLFFGKLIKKCENLIVKIAIVKSVCNLFFDKIEYFAKINFALKLM